MCTFKDFLRWYKNNKDVVPTLEAMQKMLAFYHKKGIDMLKLGCTLPNLANICLHKSTSAKFYPFTETDKDLLQKIREDMVGGPSIVFTPKAVADETFIQNSRNFKEEFRCTEMLCLCSKTYCRYDSNSNKYKFSSKGLNKRTLEDCGDGPMAKYRKVLEEFINVTSTNRGFRTVHHSVATYEQTKRACPTFIKKIVDADGIHTRPLNL